MRRPEPAATSHNNENVPAGKPPGAKNDAFLDKIVFAEAVVSVENLQALHSSKNAILFLEP